MATSDASEGPVLTLINKRIRNLRKKLNRITQIEQQNKTVKNKEQQDLLLSKPSLIAAVDELEKLRPSLTAAVEEEITLAVSKTEKKVTADDVTVTGDDVSNGEKKLGDDVSNGGDDVIIRAVEDVLKVLYFGSVFNVKSRGDFEGVMFTRSHERNCCLMYDYVTDDENVVMLDENDLDLLSGMSELLVTRPVDSFCTHEEALRKCVDHAKAWIACSENPIDASSNVTYAALREKLTKIIGSDYYKITPQKKTTADVADYVSQVPPVQVESSEHEQKEDEATDFQRNETYEGQSSPVGDQPKDEAEAENPVETPVQMDPVEAQAGGTDNKDQYVHRRPYPNQRGGGRNGGGRGNGRGYGNGRGGRSGGRGGPYQNGRNQFNDQPGGYYPRNYHGGRGRGGRGNGGGYGGGYNNHASGGGEVAES